MRETKVEKLGIVLEPTQRIFERRAVLNPGCLQDGETIHMLYRAIDHDYTSSIGYARLEGPMKVMERSSAPVIAPEPKKYKYEGKGTEDPRITKVDNTIYITYVAHDGTNAITSYATTDNFKRFKKHGPITPDITYDEAAELFREERLKDEYFMFESFYEEFSGKDLLLWEKDVFFLPEKIDGQFALFHRILPDIQIIYANQIRHLQKTEYWKEYLRSLSSYVVLEKKHWFESRHIGGGAPPVKTSDGWLLIFHATEQTNQKKIYHTSAALLDLKNPLKVIGRLDRPLFSPTEGYEQHGFVDNVVFATGTAVFGKYLYIYYGAGDSRVAVARVNIRDLIHELKLKGN